MLGLVSFQLQERLSVLVQMSPRECVLSRVFLLQALLALLFPACVGNIEILHLWSPTPMRNGSEEPAILDCDYELEEEDKVREGERVGRQHTIANFSLLGGGVK